jgi:hypothetical protein
MAIRTTPSFGGTQIRYLSLTQVIATAINTITTAPVPFLLSFLACGFIFLFYFPIPF